MYPADVKRLQQPLDLELMLSSVLSDATERLNKDLDEPRASVIFSNIRCHRKTGQGLAVTSRTSVIFSIVCALCFAL
ncbi:hypothetical protein ABFA07_021977 [Porites harrisoni]